MILRETCQRNIVDIFENPKVNQILRSLIENKSHIVFDVLCETHLAIFYPLPWFELEVINMVLHNVSETIPQSSKY